MTHDFETFTREKISRLRADADALEKILKEYQAVVARASGSGRRMGSEGSAFGVILDAIQNAGPNGLTLDEMIAVASEAGHEVKRNTLRSQLWQAKQDGKVEPLEAGRYRVGVIPTPLPGLASDTSEPERSTFVVKPKPQGAPQTFSGDIDDEIPF